MLEKGRSIIKEIVKTLTALCIMLLPGIVLDIVYWTGDRHWLSWEIFSLLRHWNITYSNAFHILGSNFGVIVAMFSMLVSMNNNIFERFEKKAYGIPRVELYPHEGIYRYCKRMCLLAPVLMLVFLNMKFCVSGYAVFLYCACFLWWYYYRHISSFSKPLDETVFKLKSYLPQEGAWDVKILTEYQLVLENIGRSAEEDANWKEIEILYDRLCDATQNYDPLKRYITIFCFYQTVVWRRNRRSHVIPMEMLWKYLSELDSAVGGAGSVPEQEWPKLWAMMRVAVCESDEGELVRFLQWFYDFPDRSSKVLAETEKDGITSELLEEEAGILILLLEFRIQLRLPKGAQLIEQLKEAWGYSGYIFLSERNGLIYRVREFSQGPFEEGRNILETAIENLKEDYRTMSQKSLIANLISM